MTNLPLSSPSSPDPSAEVRREVEKSIKDNRVILFMKGTPLNPSCGFSAQAADVLSGYLDDFAWVNVLEDPRIRQELTSISKWPTIPQLFVDGELVGGADIIGELDRTNELAELLG